MESDSSLENEDAQQARRDWSSVPAPAHNSDVSDDENFSRGAKSIESPPESPWGGANLDSPPASPAPRGSPGSERAPQTPDSAPDSPRSSSGSTASKNHSRKSRSSGSENRSASPGSEDEADSSTDDKRLASPRSDKEPQSPEGPESPDDTPRSPSSDKDGPLSPTSESDKNRRPEADTHESSDSDVTPVRNSYHSDSDEEDRSPEDFRRRRKSDKRCSSVSSAGSGKGGKGKSERDKDLDLSDVSDCDSLGPVSDEDKSSSKHKNGKEEGEKTELAMIDDSEQLDFEAEETEKVENGELVKTDSLSSPHNQQQVEKKEDGEEEELEEGELSDEGEARPEETEPRPVCRFFSRGQCTWGSSCSYRHVGEGRASQSSQVNNEHTTPQKSGSQAATTVEHPPITLGPPMMHHGLPMIHSSRFVPRPHGPPFFRRPLRPMFPRFVHPGVTDKGNYTMFEMVRPLVPMNAGGPMLHGGPHGPPHHPPHHLMYPPHMDPYMRPPHIERPPPPMQMPPPYQHQHQQQQPPVPRKESDSQSESAWERGLRQAKEMIRKSSKRKETDADFEEKKMTMSGGEGVDKENEFYSQPPHSATPTATSPFEEDHYSSRYNKVEERRISREGYRDRGYGEYGAAGWGYDEETSPPPVHHRTSHHYPSRHHHPAGGREPHSRVEYEYYDERERDRERVRDRGERDRRRQNKDRRSGRKSRSYRDKQSPRPPSVHLDKQPPLPYDISPSETAEKRRYDRSRGSKSKRGGDDEWADPWMRSKSPARKARTVRKASSYSSKSSFSSSSSSRSSSYSSYSRSESRSSVSGSTGSRSRSTSAQRKNRKRKTSPRSNKSPFSRVTDKRSSDAERSLHMNPPAPSPTVPNIYSRLSPTQRKERKEMSARLLAAAIKQKHKRASSKSSSSGSDSSNSSDDSSSSLSDSHSSSSSRTPSPAPLPSASHKSSRKKAVMDEKMAQTLKVKAMDALKLSGQKQQIKLNLKGKDSLSERLQQLPVSSSRKRAAESLPFDDSSPPNLKMLKKAVPSRREELLKQLKAVEDAIARKRSKI